MEAFLLYVFFALIVAWLGSATTLGFGSTFLLSLLLTPVVGFLIMLFYPSKKPRQLQISEQQKQTKILQQLNTSSVSIADEIEKLKRQLDTGVITENEFNQLKARLIEKL